MISVEWVVIVGLALMAGGVAGVSPHIFGRAVFVIAIVLFVAYLATEVMS